LNAFTAAVADMVGVSKEAASRHAAADEWKDIFTFTQEPQGCHMTQDVEGDPLPSAEGYLSAFPTET